MLILIHFRGKSNHLKSILGQNPSSVSTQNADRLALPPIEQPQDPQQPTRTSSNAIHSNSSTVSTVLDAVMYIENIQAVIFK